MGFNLEKILPFVFNVKLLFLTLFIFILAFWLISNNYKSCPR